MFRTEAARLRQLLGTAVVLRVEHMGSTAVPGLSAKPVIDMLIEVPSFESARRTILPRLREEGWEYLWREARRYEQLKSRLASEHPGDRQAYTEGKGEYVSRITAEALSRAGSSSEAGDF